MPLFDPPETENQARARGAGLAGMGPAIAAAPGAALGIGLGVVLVGDIGNMPPPPDVRKDKGVEMPWLRRLVEPFQKRLISSRTKPRTFL